MAIAIAKKKIHDSRLCAAGELKYFNRIIALNVCSQFHALAKIYTCIHTHIAREKETKERERTVVMIKQLE